MPGLDLVLDPRGGLVCNLAVAQLVSRVVVVERHIGAVHTAARVLELRDDVADRVADLLPLIRIADPSSCEVCVGWTRLARIESSSMEGSSLRC
jgi:hypothetical protein